MKRRKSGNTATKVTEAKTAMKMRVAIITLFAIMTAVLNFQTAEAQTTDLIKNGGFENTVTEWGSVGDFYTDSQASYPYKGAGYGYVSKSDRTPGNNLSGLVQQGVDVPSDMDTAEFSFWRNITSK